MPYDDVLADRVRLLASRRRGFAERRMFGGLAFLLHGNMCLGVWKEFLIVRVGPSAYEAALDRPHVRQLDFTGRPMRGWAMVEPSGVQRDSELAEWANLAIDFVSGLSTK